MPWASRRSAHSSELSPAGTSTHRYILAPRPAPPPPRPPHATRHPPAHRPDAPCPPPAQHLQGPEQHLSLAAVDVAGTRDVLLVAPRGDGGALHELLGRCAHRRPVGAQRVHHPARAGDETRPVA